MKLSEAIAIRVKNLLEERGLNQYYLYKNGGIPKSTISELINSKNKRVSVDTVYQIATTLELSLEEFFSDPIFKEVDD